MSDSRKYYNLILSEQKIDLKLQIPVLSQNWTCICLRLVGYGDPVTIVDCTLSGMRMGCGFSHPSTHTHFTQMISVKHPQSHMDMPPCVVCWVVRQSFVRDVGLIGTVGASASVQFEKSQKSSHFGPGAS